MNKNIIPVAFATDENYAMPLSVAMTSLLENANKTTHYDIYVLIDKEFSVETKDKILTLQDRYDNCKIEFISLEHKFDDVEVITYVTKVGCYRLLLCSLLPNIAKCIYLDCDVIVQQDLTQMFNIDVDNHYVAGVKDAYTIFEYGQNHADEIGVSKIDQYINSGVLVLNLDKIRKDNLEKIFLELTKRKFTRYVDQDIINIACYDKIKHINLKYNLQTLLFRVINNKISTQNCVKACFESAEITESLKNNIIMHFSSSPKPWDNKSVNCSEIWWKYYNLSPYNRNLITKQSNENLNLIFICEENNVKSLSVAITSLLENMNGAKYQINILSTDNYLIENQKLLYKFQENYDCNITLNTCENINKLSCEDISKTISNFYENIDRCIYLDYNIIAQGYLTELLNFDLINNSIGGVRQIDGEINSSVLLIDCAKVRDNTIEIGEIDLKFNLQAYLLKGEKTFKFGKQVEIKGDLVEKFDKKQLKTALRDNVIFSYTDDINPFTCDSCSFSYIWWKYFRLSPFSKLKRISPKVSAILPVYNVGKYLRECLDSLINQTLEDIEIILVNDGSTDNSLEILREYAEFDKRIIILDQENQGAATARNNGLAIARGEYLSILDSDDFFDLTLLEKAYNNAIENDSDIVVYNYMGFNNNNEHFNKVNHMFPPINGAFSYKDIPDQIFNTLSHNAWSKMFKAEFIKNIDVKFQCVYRTDDVYFTNMALLQAKRITTIDNHLVYYRIGISSQSTSAREPLSFVDAWKEVLSKIKSLGLYNEVEKSFVNSMLHSTLYHLSIMKNTDGYELVYDYIANELDRDFELSKCENGIIHPQLYSAYNSIKNKQSYENDYIVNSSLEDLEIDDTRVKMSVIIPVYNAEKFLKESIDSVIKQSLKNIEIICVDDGSTDKSLKILNKLAKDNKNITVLTQKNQYACVARNNGLSKATGEYIFFFDCDDILYDNKVLENMYVIAKQNNLDVLRGKAVTFDSDTKKIIEDAYYNLSNIPKNYFNRLLDLNTDYKAIFSCSNTPWSGICNREFLINNNIKFPNLISCEDESFFIETVLKAERITIADINILKYRVNNNTSFVLARFVHFDHLFKSYELIENLCKEYSNDISLFVLNLHLSGRLYWLQRSENSQYFIDNLRLCKGFIDNLDYSYWGGIDNCQLYNSFCKYFEYVINNQQIIK